MAGNFLRRENAALLCRNRRLYLLQFAMQRRGRDEIGRVPSRVQGHQDIIHIIEEIAGANDQLAEWGVEPA